VNHRQPSPPAATTRRIGTAFWVLFWGLALLVAIWQFGSWETRRAFPNGSPSTQQGEDFVQIELQANHKGHYLVDGTINGQPVRLLIDTGATQVAIPSGLAPQLGLAGQGAVIAHTANGRAQAQRTRIQTLGIGPIMLYDVDAMIMPTMEGPILLGMSALGQLELSQRDNILRLSVHPQ